MRLIRDFGNFRLRNTFTINNFFSQTPNLLLKLLLIVSKVVVLFRYKVG